MNVGTGDPPLLLRGRYEVLRTVGAGGEGHVVQARDRQHDRLVALKVRTVRPDTPVEQVLQEPRALLGLTPHPALPLVREDFFEGDVHYTVLDWVEGSDLETVLQTKGTPGLTPSSVLAYLADAAAALTFLHQHDPPVIHGDMKPANLILARGGRITLVDFGMSSSPGVAGRTSGTLSYQAPELAAGGPPSRAGDVYALAATAFALITGSPPDGVLPNWAGLDEKRAQRLEAGLRAGLATDPAQRPATPGELVELLRGGWASTLPTGVVSIVTAEIDADSLPWDSDPSGAAETLVRCDEIVAGIVEARDGRFLKPIGEATSTISAFHSAEQAVTAAIEAARALAGAVDDVTALARFAVHTGEVQVRGASYLGTATTVATRIRAEAEPGEVLISGTTADLVGAGLPDGYAVLDVGSLDLGAGRQPGKLKAITGPGLSTPRTSECPYRGLLAFGPDDHDLYFGREAALAEALTRISPGGLLAVIGASGSGKTSLLGAGIASAARDGGIRGVRSVRVITPGTEPSPGDAEGPDDELLIVDQFEELFTLCRHPELRAEFVGRLLSRSGPTAIGLRADFYGETTVFGELAARLVDNQLLLGPMREDDLRRAIAEPARRSGLRLEPGLVDRVLRDVDDQPGALPLMSHALHATWERRDGRTLTVAAYEASGGVTSAVARTADAVLATTPGADRDLLRGMFVRMTELGDDLEDTRRRVPIDELVAPGESGAAARELLERLSRARLVTLDAGTAEVAHEVLIRHWPTLRAWLDEDRDGIRLHRRLSDVTRLWEAGGRVPTDLYRGTRLEALQEWVQTNGSAMNAGERAFLDASIEESRRQRQREAISNRRLRQAAGLAAGLLLVAAVLLVVTLASRHDAVQAEGSARVKGATFRSQDLSAVAREQVSHDPQLALLLARAALKAAPTPAAMLATSEALDANTVLKQLPSFGVQKCLAANYMYLLDEGRTAVDNTCDGSLVFADLEKGEITKRVKIAPSMTVLLPPVDNGRTLLLTAGTRELAYDVPSGRLRTLFTAPFPIYSVDVSPDGRSFAVGNGETVAVVDVRTKRARTVARSDLSVNFEVYLRWVSNRRLLIAGTGQTQGNGTLPAGLSTLDVRSGRFRRYPLPVAPGGLASVTAFTLSPDHRVAYVSGSEFNAAQTDQSGAVWAVDLASGRLRWVAHGPTGTRTAPVVTTADGRFVATGYTQGIADVLDARTGALTVRHRGRGNFAGWVAFGPDGRTLVIVTLDGVFGVWRNTAGERLQFRAPDAPALGYPEGSRNPVLIGTRGVEFDNATGRTKRTYPGFPSDSVFNTCRAACFAVSPGFGRLTYLDPKSATPRIVELNTRTGARVAAVSVDRLEAQAVADDGRIASAYVDGATMRAQVIDPRTGRTRRLEAGPSALGCNATTPSFSADGGLVAMTDGCVNLSVWNTRTGRRVRTVVLPDRSNGAVAASSAVTATGAVLTADGRFALVLVADAGLVRVNLATGAVTERPGEQGTAVAVAPDGRFYVVGRRDGTVDEFDARTLRVVRHLTLPTAIEALAYSPDGREFAVKDQDAVEIWDTCAVCQSPTALARRGRRESVRTLTPSEVAAFGVSSP
ncbi:MAG: hypothetical protein JWO02_3218 [Solirubrobacterales bacterium]|nr:hypothetical protein [Solirubrobacterales bacterium]